ncbi:MAG: phosphoserine aminotransferase [Actinomycetota bacterium]|jgi:phosphoserine aminotransferase|nr:phosphoserine aminotransferase [Actinomycetota bacterium]
MEPTEIVIPPELRPADGRFASGPSKVRPEALAALLETGGSYMGTSHRQAPVRDVVGRLRAGLRDLFSLPDGYEVVLGTGGSTAFWDAAVFGLIEDRSEHLVFGEFSSKFAKAVSMAPHLKDPVIIESEPGTHPEAEARDDVDVYALTENETSTGVFMPVKRPGPGALTVVDATSSAGATHVDISQADVYYFAPQKVFASDGGLWIAIMSPDALDRVASLAASDRYIPPFFNLQTAVDNSRKNQTYNTPGLATLFLMVHQLEAVLEHGGLKWAAERSHRNSYLLYSWTERQPLAEPFVKDEAMRSPTVGTIDLAAEINAESVSQALRANGIVDTEPYRKLGRNQLRVALYPAIENGDIELLTRSIDYVIDVLLDS